MNPILGRTQPDPAGEALGTDMQRFESPTGIHGLCREGCCRLEILAIVATIPGTGQFRRFIVAAKQAYPTIFIWHVWNVRLEATLKRYGFVPATRTEPDGEVLTGYRWG